MVHEAAEKCQKKVSNSICPKKHLFRKMGRGGGVFNIALVPLQDGQLAVDLAIWSRSTESDPWEATYWTSKIQTPPTCLG